MNDSLMPMPVSFTVNRMRESDPSCASSSQETRTVPARAEFHRVRNQVDQTLLDSGVVAEEALVNKMARRLLEHHALLLGRTALQNDDGIQKIGQCERAVRHGHLSAFYAAQIQHVVDDGEQVLPGFPRGFQVLFQGL